VVQVVADTEAPDAAARLTDTPGTTTSDAVLMVTVHVLLVLTVVEVGEQLSVDFVASGVRTAAVNVTENGDPPTLVEPSCAVVL
jgi:hypothetical protein